MVPRTQQTIQLGIPRRFKGSAQTFAVTNNKTKEIRFNTKRILSAHLFSAEKKDPNLKGRSVILMKFFLTLFLLAPAFAKPFEISGTTEPFSVVFDKDGALLGVEYEKGNRVFRYQDGELTFIAGSQSPGGQKLGDVSEGDGGPATKGRFNGMHDLALHPDGLLFLADTFNRRIRVIDTKTSKLSTLKFTGPPLKSPYTVSINPKGTHLLIADLKNYQIREIDLKSMLIRTVAGNGKRGKPTDGGKATKSPLYGPRAAVYGADGSIYIASREGHALRHVDLKGRIHTLVNTSGKKGYSGDNGPGPQAKLKGPKHLALDPEGNIVISDDNNHCLRLYKVKEKTIHLLAGSPGKAGKTLGDSPLTTKINRPHGARYDSKGGLWIADSMNHRLLHFPK